MVVRLAECHPDRKHEAKGLCRKCYHNREPYEKTRNNQLKVKFGITLVDYERILLTQQGLCALCSKTCPTGRALAVDHDHVTGVVRGLLCARCNRSLGLLGNSPVVLRRAAEYLERSAA